MKKTALTLVFILTLAFGADAQILWKVSGNGIERPSYLLGTHHIAPVAILDTLTGFTDALQSVDKIYGELVMADASSAASQQKMAMAAMAPADSTLSKVLTPAQMDSVTAVLRLYMGPQMDASMFDAFRPAMVATLLGLAQTQKEFPEFTGATPIDAEVQNRAIALGKEIGSFETMDQQCAMLFGYPIAQQAAELLETVRDDDYAMEMIRKLSRAYLNGDLNSILAIMEDPKMTTEESRDRILNSRNAAWMKVIAGLLPAASVLIAVGAGHLPGEKGLISLLRKNGYTVEPVRK